VLLNVAPKVCIESDDGEDLSVLYIYNIEEMDGMGAEQIVEVGAVLGEVDEAGG